MIHFGKRSHNDEGSSIFTILTTTFTRIDQADVNQVDFLRTNQGTAHVINIKWVLTAAFRQPEVGLVNFCQIFHFQLTF